MGCPDSVIQLICRWKCLDSLQEYAQVGTTTHLSWTARAANANVDNVHLGNMPALDNSAVYAEILDPSPAQQQAARSVVRAAASRLPLARPPPPPLAAGDRIQVLWGDRWFAGTFTSSRVDAASNLRESRILYDAIDGWRKEADWHVLNDEQWRHADA